MEITKLSTKGQIILPASIRAARDFQPGDEFAVEASARGIFLRPLSRPFPPSRLEDVIGCLAAHRSGGKGNGRRARG